MRVGRKSDAWHSLPGILTGRDVNWVLVLIAESPETSSALSSNPMRKRGRALPSSLTLRLTFNAVRLQYTSQLHWNQSKLRSGFSYPRATVTSCGKHSESTPAHARVVPIIAVNRRARSIPPSVKPRCPANGGKLQVLAAGSLAIVARFFAASSGIASRIEDTADRNRHKSQHGMVNASNEAQPYITLVRFRLIWTRPWGMSVFDPLLLARCSVIMLGVEPCCSAMVKTDAL
jgi:hypothetical protein